MFAHETIAAKVGFNGVVEADFSEKKGGFVVVGSMFRVKRVENSDASGEERRDPR